VDVPWEPVARAVRGYTYFIYPHREPAIRRGTWLRRTTPDTEVRIRFPVLALPSSPSRMNPTLRLAISHDESPHAWTAGTITKWLLETCNNIGPSPTMNSSGHRIANGRARRPPRHASAHPHQDSLHRMLIEDQRRRRRQVHQPYHKRNTGCMAFFWMASRHTPGSIAYYADLRPIFRWHNTMSLSRDIFIKVKY
jgi:hypothetical protein